ncbi:hypothetical protein [Isoptericola variabilis]|uniref:Uncharacterized protein n=1 Tax=Isoptericola variabilis (strain 225) TaxID=743718 RepID=F6FUM1_ISOV2|nr:hypothetical protein [Isoptericola variabilis]AEG45448.1 hypothetical protein Isova_2753 [Isoptericola variabilis 225]TWH31529.1 hypothetical protein L600_002300000210 [Isoptericola variabilis J7]
MSDALARAGATWDADPAAGAWIRPLLGEFGPTVAATVPRGYAAHAVVAIEDDEPYDPSEAMTALDPLLDVLDGATGDQPVHCALWEGWGWLYDHGVDPRRAPGMAAFVLSDERVAWWDVAGRLRARAARASAQARAEDRLAAQRVERPASRTLEHPHRSYHLWTGPLRAVTALRHWPDPPSLVWPDDRSWFLSIPEYSREAVVAGTPELVDAVLRDPRLRARPAAPETVLDIDD